MCHLRNGQGRHFARWNTIIKVIFCLFTAGFGVFSGRAQTNVLPSVDLTLKDYLHRVIQYNQTVQAQMVDTLANEYKEKSGYGIFEPQLDTEVSMEADKRLNNNQEESEQDNGALYVDKNILYNGNVDMLTPIGTKVQLGATMSDLDNNINPNLGIIGVNTNNTLYRQYQTFAGLSLTQPLLKNAWLTPVMADIRLAALDSEIAFQQYRRQLMLTIYQAEVAYWNLYFAQEQIQFYDDSVSAAQEVLNDSQEKMKAGQGAELDVMEAQSALALRNTKRNDAVQEYYDALDHMQVLAGVSPNPNLPASGSPQFRAVDDPHTTNSPPSYADTYEDAYSLNPDYLIQQEKMNQERLRLGVAKNQLLPELDAKGAYGFNGLGSSPGPAWGNLESQSYVSWSAGLELIVPLGGNIKGRNELKEARLHLQEAYIDLKGVETEMANSLSTAIQKARAWQQSIQSYQTVVDYNHEVFQTQLARLKSGTADAQAVLDAEADWLDSRQDLAGALSQYHGSLLQIELADGALLYDNGMEITRKQLQQETEAMLAHNQNYSVTNIPSAPSAFFPPVPPPSQNVSQ